MVITGHSRCSTLLSIRQMQKFDMMIWFILIIIQFKILILPFLLKIFKYFPDLCYWFPVQCTYFNRFKFFTICLMAQAEYAIYFKEYSKYILQGCCWCAVLIMSIIQRVNNVAQIFCTILIFEFLFYQLLKEEMVNFKYNFALVRFNF